MGQIAKMSGVYSAPEAVATNPHDAALELWEADLAVAEAEEDESIGYGYDADVRARRDRARAQYLAVTGTQAPDRLTTAWLLRHH